MGITTALVIPWWVLNSAPTGCETEWIAPSPFWNATAPIDAAAIICALASRSVPSSKARGK